MKTKEKIDLYLWAFMWLLPVLAYFIQFYRSGTAVNLLAFIDENFTFDFIKNLLNNIWQHAFDSNLKIAGYLSYLVVVEIAHCLFDVVVFIPRFAHEVIDKGVHLCRKEK